MNGKGSTMKKSFRCTIDMDGFRKTSSGKRKIWRTDNEITYCCSLTPSLFIWEKNTAFNNYNGYNGYVNPNVVNLI